MAKQWIKSELVDNAALLDTITTASEDQVASYYGSLSDVTKRALKKFNFAVPTIVSNVPYPDIWEKTTAYTLMNLYTTHKKTQSTVNHLSYIDLNVGASVFVPTLEVSYDCAKAEIEVSDDSTTDGVVKTHSIVHQCVVGEVEKKKLPEIKAHYVAKVAQLMDMDTMQRKPVAIKHFSKFVKEDPKWLTATVMGLASFKNTGNYDNGMYKLSLLDAVNVGLKEIFHYDTKINYLSDCDYEIETVDKFYNSIVDSSYTKKVLNNIDLPRPWFNCVMKWGAIAGYLEMGDPSIPRMLPKGAFFGVSQFGAVRVAQECKFYDKDRKTLPPLSKNIDEKIAAKMKLYMPEVKVADIINKHNRTSKVAIFSNAWDDKFTKDDIRHLLDLVEGINIIRFKCTFSMLCEVLKERSGWGEYVVLNYGNVCSREIFFD